LIAQLSVGIIGRDDTERVAALHRAGYRLPHLANRAALERELIRPQHRLVPDRDGAHAEAPVRRKASLRCSEDRQTPATRVRDAPELEEKRIELRLVTNGITAHECRASDDPIGEDRVPRRREEEALVATQGEEREAVAAVGIDELSYQPPVADGLRDDVRERP